MVCRLQLLLALASAVILGSESRGTRDHILLFQIRDSPNMEGEPYLGCVTRVTTRRREEEDSLRIDVACNGVAGLDMGSTIFL
jgi:hypothetical protein